MVYPSNSYNTNMGLVDGKLYQAKYQHHQGVHICSKAFRLPFQDPISFLCKEHQQSVIVMII